jgi:hypothetical protein
LYGPLHEPQRLLSFCQYETITTVSELGRITEGAVGVFFKVLLRHSYEETEENQGDFYGIQCLDWNINRVR